jgi:carbon storage regulator CsrA
MLVLSRKPGEKVSIGTAVRKAGEKSGIGMAITVTVVEVKANRVKIGIEAPEQVSIVRGELDHGPKKP